MNTNDPNNFTTNPQQTTPGQLKSQADKKQRLSDNLRLNLMKRKQQTRARKEMNLSSDGVEPDNKN